MNVERKYWKWDEDLNCTEYKLGAQINVLKERGLASKIEEEPDEYTGVNNVPWRIVVTGGRITSIFYRQNFFPLPNLEVWDLELKDFEGALNKMLQPANEEEKGDKLIVTFREFFAAVAGIVADQAPDDESIRT